MRALRKPWRDRVPPVSVRDLSGPAAPRDQSELGCCQAYGPGRLHRRRPRGHNRPLADGGGLTMHNALWGYAIAIALACASLFVKDKAFPNVPWLGFALALLACLIAFLASLGLAHGKGWLSRITLRVRPSQPRSLPARAEIRRADDIGLRQAAPAGRAPRPAGPAGPVPVLEKRPEDATGDAVATPPSGIGSSKRSSDA
jgi:hypothetical protein